MSLHDGAYEDSTLVGVFSGDYVQPPTGYRSTQAYMLVTFHSNKITNYGGFNASYMSVVESAYNLTFV